MTVRLLYYFVILSSLAVYDAHAQDSQSNSTADESLNAVQAQPSKLAFSIADIRAGRTSDVPILDSSTPWTAEGELPDLAVARSPTGVLAIIDRSMLREGVTAAANPSFVDLSWVAYSSAAKYGVSRDGELIATLPVGVSSFRDMSVVGGSKYRYNIVPLNATDADSEARMWSMNVRVPVIATGDDLSTSLQLQAATEVSLASVAATSTVTWMTFIAPSRIDGPIAGCDYGSGYQYGGDGHGYDWTSSSYRTAVHAVVNWSTKAVSGFVSIGTTKVYRKSDGALVSQRTASGADSYARKLGSGTNYVDVRLVTHANNPYCFGAAIDGAFSMHLTQSGNYSIFSGNHRQMPNHYVYIYDGGQVTSVYRRDGQSVLCLIGVIACELANFYGSGAF